MRSDHDEARSRGVTAGSLSGNSIQPIHPSEGPGSDAAAPRRTRRPAWPLAVAVALAVGACGGGDGDGGPTDPIEIRTLSNRADLISGDDAMLQVLLPSIAPDSSMKVLVNDVDQTTAFSRRSDGRMTGLVTGLRAGDNRIVVRADLARTGQLQITNSPRGGPVLSGAQITPFFCATPTPQGATDSSPATNASGLGTAAIDATCNIASEYKFYYRTTAAGCSTAIPDPSPPVAFDATTPPAAATPPTNPCFKPYEVGAAAPADLAMVTTSQGAQVPYVVRVERGTMNRGIYDIAVLVDPARPVDPGAPQAQWNGKLLYQFGASTGQLRRQFRPASAWSTSDAALAAGYMVAAHSMTDSGTNSNRVMMTETVMMMKEHIVDHYGPIRFTMGNGCSGGSINSNMNASIAPGQIDGFTIACAYPDSETTAIEVADCVQLVEAYQKPQWLALMTGLPQTEVNAKKAAINGHPDQTGCHGWYNAFGSNSKTGSFVQRYVLDNATGAIVAPGAPTNNCQLPTSLVYDPTTNPGGARCSAWDWSASVFGKAPDGIRAYDTRDNVGIQYGLNALLAGAITGEEFVTLNEVAGGSDKDSNPMAARSVADTQALTVAYRSGIVMSGRNLARTAVIDMRGWDDTGLITQPGTAAPSQIPIHFVWRSFSIRDRLDREFGDHGNQVMWRFGRGGLTSPVLAPQAFAAMDLWLTTLVADTSQTAIEQKVRNAKPATATDFCLLSTDVAQSTRVTDPAICDADPFLKASSSPRRVAGGPLSENILKCQLKPIDPAVYGSALDAAQLARLQVVFPDGVCDWSKPGVEQQAAIGPLDFRAGPGGQPLPAAPVSTH